MVGVVKPLSRPSGASQAADHEPDDNYPLGAWKDGKFSFTSPQAETQWRQDSVQSGVHFQNWSQGRKLNEKNRQLVELGFTPSADIYRGPDGGYYQMTPAAQEDPQVTTLRSTALKSDPGKADIGTVMQRANARITPQAMALMNRQAPIADAAPAAAPKPANDNKSGNSAADDNAGVPASPGKDPPAPGDALARSVARYETDNPVLTRAGQRLKAGALDLGASASAGLAALEETSRQTMAPYLDQIDKGKPLNRVLPTLADGEIDPSLGLTPLDVDFIRRYYGAGDERAELREQLSSSIDGLVGAATDYDARSQAIPRHPAVAAIAQAIREKRYGDAAKIAAAYPVGVAAQTGVESLPSLVPALAAGMVDPPLGVAALTGTGAAQAYGSSILGYLGQQGIDVTNPTAVREALADPAVLQAAKGYAAAHASISVGTDLALGGFGKAAGGILRATSKTVGKEAQATKGAAEGAALEDAAAGGATNIGNAEKGLYLSTRPVAGEFPELDGINPGYVEDAGPGVNTNCVSCLIATQERLAGKNPLATATPSKGYADYNALLQAFPYGTRRDISSISQVEKEIIDAGDGATGFVLIPQKSGVMHALNVVNRKGTVYFIDSQIGKIVTLPSDLKIEFGAL